jgi:hypothetical protein
MPSAGIIGCVAAGLILSLTEVARIIKLALKTEKEK